MSLVLLAGLITGCANQSSEEPETTKSPEPAEAIEDTPMPKSGIAVPKNVRENLGITFVEVERRAITETRRVPGRFELRPEARREYRATLQGGITLAVKQFQEVKKGDLLYSINSPQWRQIQHDAVEAEGEIVMEEAKRDVLLAKQKEAKSLLEKTKERIANLQKAGTRNAELEAQITVLESSFPRISVELKAQETAIDEAYEHYQSRLRILSSVTGLSEEALKEETDSVAHWRTIQALEIRAGANGTVEDLNVNNGGWLNEGELALSTLDHRSIRFHAEASQVDLGLFRDNQQAQIVPGQGSSLELQSIAKGSLRLGLTAHSNERTISLYVEPDEVPEWARAGISAFLEVKLTEQAKEEWSIPMAAVVQDGLEQVFFRRDPKNPDQVLRVLADLGENDGRWVAVRSRVKKGDQIVLDGAYALQMSNVGQQAPEGYHYHADGTLHKNH